MGKKSYTYDEYVTATEMAKRIALQGGRVPGTHDFVASWVPWCDAPVRVSLKGGQFDVTPVPEIHCFFDVPCRKCEKCKTVKRLMWRDRAKVETARAPRTWMLTLTFEPVHLAGIVAEANNEKKATSVFLTTGQAIERAAYRHVQKYLKRLRKAARCKLRFLAVHEYGEKTGRLHYHLLLHEVDRPITKRTLERQWRSFVHARLVAGDDRAVAYVTKYLTKDFTRPRASKLYGRLPSPL